MEVNLQQKRKGLEVKIPDISKTLDVVRFLEARRVSHYRITRLSHADIEYQTPSASDSAQNQQRYQNDPRQTTTRKAKQKMKTTWLLRHRMIQRIS